MREIKFRGLSTVSGEWIYGDLIQRTTDFIFPAGVYTTKIYEYLVEIRPETKGQYTGFKDRNGTEIYEGDILEVASKDLKFQVVYEEPSFNRKWIDDISKRYREHLTEPLAWNTYIICEVIGNIYENPELLEADSDE